MKVQEAERISKNMLKMKDERMDYEASLDQIQDKERAFKEEVVTLNEQLKGKDQAIKALSTSLMEKAQDHEALSTRFNDFKNQLILENSFHS